MAQSVDGLYLNKYVDPQLLIERRNYRADFMQVLGSVPAGALAADGVRRNKLINNVGFRVNNTEDFEPKQMTGKNYIVPWEIYDTEPSSCTDDEIRYLAFDKRAAIRVKHNEAFQVGIRNHVLHKLAPEDDSNEEMPVIRTTGEKDINGRLRLSYKDLVDFATLAKTWNLPVTDALYMVLSPLHMGDLLLDKDASKYFYDRTFYLDPATGKPKGFMGINSLRITTARSIMRKQPRRWRKAQNRLPKRTFSKHVLLCSEYVLPHRIREIPVSSGNDRYTQQESYIRISYPNLRYCRPYEDFGVGAILSGKSV